MPQRTSEPNLSDSIDEFFEPMLGDSLDEDLEDEAPLATGKNRLAPGRWRHVACTFDGGSTSIFTTAGSLRGS